MSYASQFGARSKLKSSALKSFNGKLQRGHTTMILNRKTDSSKYREHWEGGGVIMPWG